MPKPHEAVAAEVCPDIRMLNDNELDAVTGGYGSNVVMCDGSVRYIAYSLPTPAF
jgi:prepilin-type processing-associated H-X9-DG protein